MPSIETTNDFIYDEELMTELLLAYKAANGVTKNIDASIGVLKCYVDMRLAQYHRESEREWMSESTDKDNG